MRYFQLALLCIICVTKSYGQMSNNCYGRIVVEFTKEKRPKRIYAVVDTKSSASCLDSSWVQSIERKINQSLTYKNGAKKGKYIVAVRFIVAKDSTISDIQCENDPGYGMCTAVISAVKRFKPWKPAAQRGYPVNSYRKSAVTPQKK
jgi:hypothetical protein